ncbi:MAG: hypothetical protein AAAB20_15540 [Rhizobium sp.]|uniref:hypothetical protein n=1 Tax=Rhizobium sp. TaxID=391 RepID=UPI0030F2CE00
MKQDVKSHHGSGCCCPTCRGLKPFEQPLFAPGQVLSAADLSSLETYVKGKNRLHNRYLHGWGVVCGLEVVCDDCEGSVTVRSGYAIDPCGEDIVVSCDTRFDVIKAIRECCDTKRLKSGDCDPWAPPPDPGCKDLETHWCISLKYKEVEASYVRALATAMPGPAKSCSCGCGSASGECNCGGKSKGSGGCGCGGKSKSNGDCGCGCGGSKPQSVTAKGLQWGSSASAVSQNSSCAPRRLLECFDIGIIESPHGCMPTLFERRGDDRTPYATQVLAALVPDDSLLGRIVACLRAKIEALSVLDQRQKSIILALFAGTNPQVPASEMHTTVVRFRQIVMGLLGDDDHPVRCQMRVTAGTIILPAPTQIDERDPAGYTEQARDALRDLLAVWIQLMIDCVCHAFIPQCDDDPCDDRVEIACVTVKGDKILRICNHTCRRYAGAFPSTFYWMSLVPVLPLIGKLLAVLCCRPELVRRNSPLVNDLVPTLDLIDPSGRLRRAITDENFRLPRLYVEQIAKTLDPSSFGAKLLARLYSGLVAAGHTGEPIRQAREVFKTANVSVEEREIDEETEDKLVNAMLRHPLVQPGDSVVLHKRGDRVVAVTPAAPPSAEVASLRNELEQLRKEVRALKRQK